MEGGGWGGGGQGMYLTPRVVNACLNFLQKSTGWSNTWVVLRPHCGNLMRGCLFPLCCFNDEDQALWEEDPQEYIRKVDISPQAPPSNRKMGVRFLRYICMHSQGPCHFWNHT